MDRSKQTGLSEKDNKITDENKNAGKPAEVYAEKAETKAPEISSEEMKTLALAYARYLAEKKLKPGDATFVEPEELIEKSKTEAEKAEPAPAVSAAEKEENAPETKPSAAPEKSSGEMTKEEKMKALALEYAKMLREKGLKPGEADVTEPEAPAKESKTEEPVKAEKKSKPTEEEKKEKAKEKAKQKKTAKQAKRKAKAKAAAEKKKASGAAEAPLFRTGRFESMLASMLDTHDRMQDRRDESFGKAGRDFVRGAHKMAATYTHSRRQIGIGLLVVGVLAAAILILFDQFTVYEYAYNGKVLGYVKEQEEVTEVLDIAGEKLSQNSGGTAPVEFVANQNVTFNPVDGRGKSTDDMDTAVNKLIYMTDIETEAYAVYDGDRIVAIVKDQSSAEKLLADALATLSRPDSGMELVSAEFENELSISPINVLLSSVQSSNKALKLMTKGGEMETLHIVEEGETVESIAEKFGVDTVNVYTYGEKTEDEEEAAEEEETEDSSSDDSSSEEESSEEDSADSADDESSKESDKETAEKVSVETKVTSTDESASGGEIMQGDMVCIKSTVEPVSVRMVEEGKMKEVIEYETIKKKSDEYYQGDTRIEQEGKNGVQIFEGRLTKVAGEVVDRKEVSTSVIRDKQDKIILIGTKERPKTAPTGTYAMPLEYYTVTSEFGQRWGRLHAGIDLADPTGTTIYASDGGTVIRASYFGGYGNCVEIDHENGRVTRYGHCSAILVSEGDKVYQGQPIALVGSTGNSTGPHLHFEIILDGVQHNPREFVDF